MKKEINPKIIETINKSDNKEAIKEFLNTLLIFEHRNSEQKSPRYADYYDAQIKKFAEKWIDDI